MVVVVQRISRTALLVSHNGLWDVYLWRLRGLEKAIRLKIAVFPTVG